MSAIQSALDHIYLSYDSKEKVTGSKLKESSTDHVPIMIKLKCQSRNESSKQKKSVKKRSMIVNVPHFSCRT